MGLVSRTLPIERDERNPEKRQGLVSAQVRNRAGGALLQLVLPPSTSSEFL